MYNREEHMARVKWFRHDRFGLFIHWGLYAIPARGEWVRFHERIPKEDYESYFQEFNPTDYNPKDWAVLARKAGMKYAVFTAKHHDGFCLFDSKLTDYKSTNTPCGRDLVREYLDAFRAEGLKVGLYCSLLDWHHDDYPFDRFHPMRGHKAYREPVWDVYLAYLHGQVRELCTDYGRLDVLWFDFSYDDMTCEKWRAAELADMVRSLQPDIIMNNRLEVSGVGFGSLLDEQPSSCCGDFVSPEQIIPPQGIRDRKGEPVVWESCITLNNNWGYCEQDRFYKSASMVVRKLVECVSKGGNLLVNVGPDARGRIPPESVRILESVGNWMDKNSASVYGCGAGGLNKPDCGRITRRGERFYYHVTEGAVGPILLEGLDREDVRRIRLLATGAELAISDDWMSKNYPGVFVSLGPDPVLPDETDTVIEVTIRS